MNDEPAALRALLGTAERQPRRWRRAVAWLAVLLLVLAVGAIAWRGKTREEATRYQTEPVRRGTLSITVTANGNLQPTNKVDVGSELSGTVARVLVNINDQVQQGQVLAELDTSTLSDQVQRSRAAVADAQARVRQADAAAGEATVQLKRLQGIWRMSGGGMPSRAEMSAAEAANVRARAEQASAESGVVSAKAALRVDETHLRKAAIRSPIRGVVLTRNVDPGNAVAASLQAVTLFTLAEDLTRMKLQVNVDEADVGQVHEGQSAHFTVSAYPQRQYPATVVRVGYGAVTKDNVVTYVAELTVDNADLSLRPGMTATAVIAAAQRRDVLLVPNAALRFQPAADAAASPAARSSLLARLMPRPPQQPARRAGTRTNDAREVWVLREGRLEALQVVPGLSDGRMTEVASTALRPGMAVVVQQLRGGS